MRSHTILINARFCSRHLFLTMEPHPWGFLMPVLSVWRNPAWREEFHRVHPWFRVYRLLGYTNLSRG